VLDVMIDAAWVAAYDREQAREKMPRAPREREAPPNLIMRPRPRWAVRDFPVTEAREAYAEGKRRSRACRERSARHSYGYEPTEAERLHTDGMGAVAEAQVAAWLGREWIAHTLGTEAPDNGIDVAPNIQVRWTKLAHGNLILHERDHDARVCVLVRGDASMIKTGGLEVVGWIRAIDGKTAQFWRTENVRHPAFFVDKLTAFEVQLPPLA
jgi:hypothetical protein